jgi:DNA-binding transcriptional ArsR family regulator
VFALISRAPLSVAEVAAQLPVSRPAVSQHLKVLADAGLVQLETMGTRNHYRPDTDGLASLRDFIDSLWDVGLARFKLQAEKVARDGRPASAPTARVTTQGETMSTQPPIHGMVRKSVTVAAPLAVAFEVFTAQIEAWWPMASHHIGEPTVRRW